MNEERPTITLLCGLPASGKSTFAQKYFRDTIVLCPDEFRQVLTGQRYHAEAEEMIWSHVKTTARVLLGQRRDFVVDATCLTLGSRRQWVQIAEYAKAHIECHVILTPFAECLQRNAKRIECVPVPVIRSQAQRFEFPGLAEGFNRIELRDDKGIMAYAYKHTRTSQISHSDDYRWLIENYTTSLIQEVKDF